VSDGRLYIGTLEGDVRALNLETGETECEFDLVGEPQQSRAIYGTPVIADGRVFVGGYDGILYVLPVDCAPEWESDEEIVVGTGEPIVGSPAVVGDIVLVGSSDGGLYAFDIVVNESRAALVKRWAAPFQTDNRVWSAPAVADGVVYFGSMDHSVYAVNLDDGTPMWSEPFEAKGAISAGLAVVDGHVYFGAFDSVFYSIQASTGAVNWKFTGATGWFWGGAVVDENRVYAPSLDGNLYALSRFDGTVEWSVETEGPIIGSPVIVGDRIAVPSEDGGVYLAKLVDGKVDSQCRLGDKVKLRSSITAEDRTLFFLSSDHAIRSLEIEEFDQFWQLDEDRPAWELFTNNEELGSGIWKTKCGVGTGP